MTRAEAMVKSGFMTVAEARKFLRIGQTSMYALINSNTISHAIFRGRKVVPVKALHDYAASRIVLGNVA
jgi:hypothetical protein